MKSAFFISFSGNCREALTFYQTCFGGRLQFQTFEIIDRTPVVAGSLIGDGITIHGSDLVHNEGRLVGNHMAVYLQCNDVFERREVIVKLAPDDSDLTELADRLSLIEVVDGFGVRWVLGV